MKEFEVYFFQNRNIFEHIIRTYKKDTVVATGDTPSVIQSKPSLSLKTRYIKTKNEI